MHFDSRRGLTRASAALLCLVMLALAPLARTADTGERPVARQSPDWLRDAVIYEVFPRAFSPGGDLKGVTAQLDRLKDLGVDVVWLMPIHPMGKLKAKGTLGSRYAVRDYDAIDPAYGSPEDLKQLVAAAHQRNMKVFIDIVANHTSWDAVLMQKHPDWYRHDASGRIVPPNPDWVDVAQLDYSRPGLRNYMSGMLVRWLRDYGLDGFRCDYASGVPRDFWESVRPALDEVRPGLAFLAEADDPELLRSAFDIDYAWSFYHAVSDAIAGRQPASHVRTTWEKEEARYPRGALRLRFSDNHDQLRTTGQAGLPAALAASALMFTLDGVPLLYNGMEVGDTTESAAPALFERVPIQWNMIERRPKVDEFYKSLASLRREHAALTRGDVRWLGNADEERILSFARVGGGETLVIVANLSSVAFDGAVQMGGGTFKDITPDWRSVGRPPDAAPGVRRTSAPPAVSLAPWEVRIYRRND
jgi:glycosidase